MSWYYAENSEKYGVNEIQNFVNKEKNILLKIGNHRIEMPLALTKIVIKGPLL